MVSRIFAICDAYESGVGHGQQQDGLSDGAQYYADAELAEAYNLGYEKGGKSVDAESIRKAAYEQCAKICDDYSGGWYVHNQGAKECARAIRMQSLIK